MRATFLILLACLLLSGCATQTAPDVKQGLPGLISVGQWGGTAASPGVGRAHLLARITLHHGGVAVAPDRATADYLRALQSWSRREKGWIDLPYHLLIDRDGEIHEGRDLAFAGDTNTEYDPAGHALVVVLGNFEDEEPNPAQLDAVVTAMAWLAQRYNIDPDTIAGHNDHSAQTACPGRHLARYLHDGSLVSRVKQRLVELRH